MLVGCHFWALSVEINVNISSCTVYRNHAQTEINHVRKKSVCLPITLRRVKLILKPFYPLNIPTNRRPLTYNVSLKS